MQATKRQVLKEFWERTTANIKLDRLPLLSANEQTKFSWAREVESIVDVPEVFKGFFESLPNNDDSQPNAVLTPKFEDFIRRENQKLICALDHKVYILEDAKNGLLTTCYALEDIHYVEVGRILLNAWIKIIGVVGDGVQTSTMLKFNTVTEYMFAPILHAIRMTVASPHQADLSVEQRKFDPLGDSSFKLMNYAKDSLLPGEQVLEAILQPEIKHKILTIYGRSLYRTISPAYVSILTDKELIVIRDGGAGRWGRGDRRGGVSNYVSLERITSISVINTEGDLIALSIHLPGGDQIQTLHTHACREELERFLDQFVNVLPGVKLNREGIGV